MKNVMRNFLISLWFYINLQIVKSIELLTDGEYYEDKKSPHSIALYTFNCESSTRIYLKSEKGNPILYGYATIIDDELSITENDIIKLNKFGYLDNSYTISSISYIDYDNDKNLEYDYVLIVYCSDNNINCEYSIWYSEAVTMTLKENNNYIFYEENGHFQIDLSDYQITDNSMLKVYVTPLVSYIYFTNITKNDIDNIQIRPTKVDYSINDVYSFKLNDTDKKYSFSYSANIYSIVQIRYVIEENEKANKEITISKGISEIFNINNDEEIIYKIDSSSFRNLFIFDITAQNCEMNIQEIENDNIINEFITSFYQVQYKKTDSFIIKVRNNEKIKGTSCKLISYGFEKDLVQSLVLLEGVEQKFEFTPDIQRFELQYHFRYFNTHLLSVKMNFILSPETVIKLKVNNQNYIESEVDVSKEEYTLVFKDESLYFCVPEKICTITFIVYSASDYPDKEIFSFAINSINERQIYLPKNQMRENYHYSNKDVFYYTNVSRGEYGEIKWNYMNELTDISFSIFEKDNITLNKRDFFTYNETSKMDLHRGRIKYYVDEKQYECKNGCELWIYIKNLNVFEIKKVQKILIGIHSSHFSFVEELTTIVYNTFLINERDEYSYFFYLPLEIRKFQVRIYGNDVSFTIFDVNTTNECCNNLNQEFISNNDVKFIDVDVFPYINTTDYTIKIKILVNRSSYLTEDYFEFEVIPYIDNYPIHYIDNNREQFCVTDERKKCYFIIITEEKYQHSLFLFNENNEPISNKNYIVNQVDEDLWQNYTSYTDLFEMNITNSTNFKIVNEENNLYIEEYSSSVRLFVTLEFDSPSKVISIGYLCPMNNNFQISLLKENPIFVSVSSFLFFQPYSYQTEVQLHNILIEIAPVQGNGTIIYHDSNKFNGPTKILLTDGNCAQSISIVSESQIVCFLKLQFKQKKNYIITKFNFLEHNRFFLNSDLPFKILSELDPNEEEEEIKITLSIENLSNKNYIYSNLEILAGYSNNSDDFIPTQTKQVINNNQIAAIDFKLSKEKNNYKYLMLAFNHNQTTKNNVVNWKIHIVGVSDTKKRKKPPLPQSVYFFNYIDNTNEAETQYYYLQKGKAFVIDFATCSNDIFELSASCVDEPECNIEKQKPIFKNGVTRYIFSLTKEDYLYVSINLQKSNEHYNNTKRYYGINYHIYPNLSSVKNFSISHKSNLTTNFNYLDKQIKSTWGNIDNIEKGEVLFNYYLFNSTDYFNESICFIETPVYHSVTEQFNEQYSVTQKEFDYYSVVIADFVNETQDILVGYNIYNVKYKMSMLWLWLSIIFIFILLFFGYTTFTLYRQIKITDKRLLFNEKLKN